MLDRNQIIMISGRCAACKFLRRRCPADCLFSPYFPSNDPQRFESVHKIYGASNVSKMIQKLKDLEVPEHLRGEAVGTLYWEAQCRSEDPVYGCVGFIYQLHQHIQSVQMELARTKAQIVFLSNYNRTVNANHHHRHHHTTTTNTNQQEQEQQLQFQQIRSTPGSNWFI